uniref:Uncharacterized protein n=1 Tax=Chromera velia CCMP2878 TaxID=1169474 RepID=A0A0G4GA75_9ALVE|eukprot:Cvel_20969.t1-p1 / transcript=Cvel_20969.t1 / gene=Cvel_20969 / organism=Chromera_velia_CCMP2878 / gene_product=hypothetical protein / transcript_product=hypothetical protein / location=Cvel_scaffold1928:10092-12359(+) / protein_length=383 / sequence_SO=supercontig / SO=protein_coding / is_pseudo=false
MFRNIQEILHDPPAPLQLSPLTHTSERSRCALISQDFCSMPAQKSRDRGRLRAVHPDRGSDEERGEEILERAKTLCRESGNEVKASAVTVDSVLAGVPLPKAAGSCFVVDLEGCICDSLPLKELSDASVLLVLGLDTVLQYERERRGEKVIEGVWACLDKVPSKNAYRLSSEKLETRIPQMEDPLYQMTSLILKEASTPPLINLHSFLVTPFCLLNTVLERAEGSGGVVLWETEIEAEERKFLYFLERGREFFQRAKTLCRELGNEVKASVLDSVLAGVPLPKAAGSCFVVDLEGCICDSLPLKELSDASVPLVQGFDIVLQYEREMRGEKVTEEYVTRICGGLPLLRKQLQMVKDEGVCIILYSNSNSLPQNRADDQRSRPK